MPEKHLHIVSFDIPLPADYGGVIDVFYKIKALHKAGIKIHLHCFEYGRAHSTELNSYCHTVNYYKRHTGPKHLASTLPYIANTRASEDLVKNLCADKHPVLFEGLHCCYHLNDNRLRDRILLVRTHNIEHDYYSHLAATEKNLFKKLYLSREARKLKAFEATLNNAHHILAISAADGIALESRYKNVSTIPAFHPGEKIISQTGKGSFALYHGNLKVGENNEAALFLVNNVFNDLKFPLVIAGNHPSAELVKASKRFSNISLRSDVSTSEIHELIRSAHINVLPTFQSTGIKLKLLAALFEGRHCLVNSPMVVRTGLEPLCSIKDSAMEMKEEVKRLFETVFPTEEIQKREEVLISFSNNTNADKLLSVL